MILTTEILAHNRISQILMYWPVFICLENTIETTANKDITKSQLRNNTIETTANKDILTKKARVHVRQWNEPVNQLLKPNYPFIGYTEETR